LGQKEEKSKYLENGISKLGGESGKRQSQLEVNNVEQFSPRPGITRTTTTLRALTRKTNKKRKPFPLLEEYQVLFTVSTELIWIFLEGKDKIFKAPSKLQKGSGTEGFLI